MIRLLLSVCLIIFVISLDAQDKGIANDADTLSNRQLEEVIIRAYGGRHRLLTIPASVGVISTSEIRNQAFQGLPALLNLVPGVYAHQGTLNTNRITIRGIGARVPYATGRIRSAIDDIPLTNGSGYSMAEYVDPSFADHIEIAKSPNIPAHGASLGGLVLLSTLPGERIQNTYNYQLTAGSFGFQQHEARITYNHSEKAVGKLMLSMGTSDGWRENNSHNSYFGGYSGRFRPNTKTEISTLVMLQQMKAYIPSSIDSAAFNNHPRSAAANWKKTKGYENGRRLVAGITVEQQLAKEFQLKATVYGHDAKEEELRPFDHFNENRQLAGIRIQAGRTFRMDEKQIGLWAGAESFAEKVTFGNRTNMDGEGSLGDSISHNKELIRSMAYFAHAEYNTRASSITSGIYVQRLNNSFTNRAIRQNRLVNDTYRTAWNFSPRIAINQRIGKRMYAYASLSHGFAPPSLQETLDSQGLLNPEIKPETSQTYDAGLRVISEKSGLFAEITVFYLDIRNLLVAERIDADRWVGRNAGRAAHKGVEALLTWNVTETPWTQLTHLKMKANLTAGDYRFVDFIDRGTDHSGKQVPGIPRLSGGASVEARHKSGVNAKAVLEYVGQMAMNDSNTKSSNPYALVHFMGGWSGNLNKINIAFNAHLLNATNAHYASMILVNAPGQRNQRWYYPGMPRHFQLSLRIGYNSQTN